MTTRVGRTVRLSALALATGTVVVTAATGAHAAPSASTAISYAGNTGSSVVNLQVNIPSALASPLAPVLSQLNAADGSIDISLLNQVGSLQHDATGKVADVASSTSSLAGGTLFGTGGPLASLNQTVASTLAHPGLKTSSNLLGLPSNVAGLLSIGLPTLKVDTLTAPISTIGASEVAGVDVGKIADLLPAGTLASLETLLNTVAGTAATGLQSGTSSLTSTISTLLGTISTETGGATSALTAPLQADLAALQKVLTQLSNEIPSIVTNIEDGSIVSIDGLSVSHSLKTLGNEEISTVSNNLADVNLLGGLFTLRGFANSITTEAGGKAGTAKVIANPNLAVATVGKNNELEAVVGQLTSLSGSIASLLDTVTQTNVSAQLTSITSNIGTINDALNSVLNVAGVSVNVDKVTEDKVAADGSSAVGALSGLQVTINPAILSAVSSAGQAASRPAATAPLVNLQIGALQASSAAGVVAPTVTTTPTTPAAPTHRLAYTGADLPLTGAVAALLVLGGTLAARRRRSGRGGEEI